MQENPIAKISKRWWTIAAIALVAFVLLTLLSATAESPTSQGSSYSNTPSGYGAWYAFMEKRGVKMQRWQRSLQELPVGKPTTLVRVMNRLVSEESAIYSQQSWVAKGNRLVILGVSAPPTEAAFSQKLDSKAGLVTIETTRRFPKNLDLKLLSSDAIPQKLLSDEFGAVAVSQKQGKGQLILVSTPYLAANAYQDAIGNYEFLAQLVAQDGNRVLVDEYIHGYKDRDVLVKEGKTQWESYLLKTPWLPVGLQLAVVLLVLIVAQNRRFGAPVIPESRAVDNSTAYIQAMAAVLYKAQNSEFVLEVVGKAEQLRIQQALGLGGQTLLDRQAIIQAWMQQTQRPANELASVLQFSDRPRKVSEPELKIWLSNLQIVRKYLP
ncbi:DUF4350 domain-containing protein [Tumidithrix helvetica PCC 7403]|uniref:DUF4350 domain-containing protein n=1 Tax=Tumidithrix helvetica TaxID=3457545 RepID=UPI003C9A2123